MNLESRKFSLIILGITSLVCSRAVFFFFNDPEGPNLLIVMGLSVILYIPSLLLYRLISTTNLKKVLLIIFIQILVSIALYFCM